MSQQPYMQSPGSTRRGEEVTNKGEVEEAGDIIQGNRLLINGNMSSYAISQQNHITRKI